MRKRLCRQRFEKLESRELFAIVGVPDLSDIEVFDGGSFVAPIGIDDAEGIRGVAIRIRYDAAKVDIEPDGIQPGDVWEGQGMAISNVDSAEGVVTAFLFSAMELKAVGGNLIDIEFEIRDGTAALERDDFQIESLRLNEGGLEVTTEALVEYAFRRTNPKPEFSELNSVVRNACASPQTIAMDSDSRLETSSELSMRISSKDASATVLPPIGLVNGEIDEALPESNLIHDVVASTTLSNELGKGTRSPSELLDTLNFLIANRSVPMNDEIASSNQHWRKKFGFFRDFCG